MCICGKECLASAVRLIPGYKDLNYRLPITGDSWLLASLIQSDLTRRRRFRGQWKTRNPTMWMSLALPARCVSVRKSRSVFVCVCVTMETIVMLGGVTLWPIHMVNKTFIEAEECYGFCVRVHACAGKHVCVCSCMHVCERRRMCVCPCVCDVGPPAVTPRSAPFCSQTKGRLFPPTSTVDRSNTADRSPPS